MTASLIRLESRYDRRIDQQSKDIDQHIATLNPEAQQNRCNVIFQATLAQIKRNYAGYAEVTAQSDAGKALKKELFANIGLIKKVNRETLEQLDSNLEEVNASIDNLKDKHLLFKIFDIFIKHFPSFLSVDTMKTFSKKCIGSAEVNEFFNWHDERTRLYTLGRYFENKNKEIQEIEDKVTEKQSKDLGKEVWRPRRITKESLLQRIKSSGADIFKNEGDRGKNYIDSFYRKIKSSNFKGIELDGLNKIDNNVELIKTSKNNRYLVVKEEGFLIGSGSSKEVYVGLDLSKNKLVAIAFAKGNFIEEETYLKTKGKSGIAKIKDCFVKQTNNPYEKGSIFVSDLYLNGHLEKNLQKIEDKVDFGHELINAVCEVYESGVILTDFKLKNVLVTNDFKKPKLIDLDTTGHTMDYMAPELAKNSISPPTEQTLIWSLGENLYGFFYGEKFIDQINTQDMVDEKVGAIKNTTKEYRPLFMLRVLTDEKIDEVFTEKMQKHPKHEKFLNIIRSMLKIDPNDRPSLSEIKMLWETAERETAEREIAEMRTEMKKNLTDLEATQSKLTKEIEI